jgi:hypothetical protein
LKETLERDPHPHVYRRIKHLNGGTSVIAVKRWRFTFSIEGNIVRVFGVTHSKEQEVRS